MNKKRPRPSNKELAEQLRKWYKGGERGCLHICEREDAPQAVKDHVQDWFKRGRARFVCIIDLLEQED
jgi:hypothetical protein